MTEDLGPLRQNDSRWLHVEPRAQVVSAVLVELMKPKYANGVVVDGFPRTTIQAEFIKLLYDKLQELWETSRTNPRLRHVMRRPQFSICVLYVDEVSVGARFDAPPSPA